MEGVHNSAHNSLLLLLGIYLRVGLLDHLEGHSGTIFVCLLFVCLGFFLVQMAANSWSFRLLNCWEFSLKLALNQNTPKIPFRFTCGKHKDGQFEDLNVFSLEGYECICCACTFREEREGKFHNIPSGAVVRCLDTGLHSLRLGYPSLTGVLWGGNEFICIRCLGQCLAHVIWVSFSSCYYCKHQKLLCCVFP